jgi:hypothetical protein
MPITYYVKVTFDRAEGESLQSPDWDGVLIAKVP